MLSWKPRAWGVSAGAGHANRAARPPSGRGDGSAPNSPSQSVLESRTETKSSFRVWQVEVTTTQKGNILNLANFKMR